MNSFWRYILGILMATLLLVGCHYAEVQEFNDIPRVSFIGQDKNSNDSYDPSTLKASVNFGANLKGDSISSDTILVRIRLLGELSGQPLKVSLKSLPIEGYPEAKVNFLNPYTLEDSAYRAVLKVIINRPAERNKEYKADLWFDFEQSEVAAGIDTLRHYELSVIDEVTLDMLGLGENDWDYYLAPYLGPYSDVKVRFMIMTLKMIDISILTYGPGYINRYKPQLVEGLEYYNSMNPGNPLKDENGNLISFDPA